MIDKILEALFESCPNMSCCYNRWNSWFNQETMTSRNEGSADDQGLVFFNLEPDQFVPVKVSAKGYKDFEDLINIKPNVTYLVEANMCKDVSTVTTLFTGMSGI